MTILRPVKSGHVTRGHLAMNDPSRGRLLIVGSEQAWRQALCERLGQEGYVTRGHASPREALDALRPGEFDLLLAESVTSGIDGIDLIDATRQIDALVDVLVLTGKNTIDAVLQAVAQALELVRLRRQNALLLERECRQAAELAAAYRDLEALTHSISHDLRAPLLFVKDFAKRLAEEQGTLLSEDGRNIVRLILHGSSSVDDMVVGLLAFLRSTHQTAEIVRVDMQPIVRATLTEALGAYSGPEPLVELGELPPALADPTEIRHVWTNLISNALKFSATREQPRVHIRGHVEGRQTVYAVQDNGVGFDTRYADKLFTPFKRLHSSANFPGTGVGLAIAHRIVGRHGGRIWADSSPGAGATFQFALPIAPSPGITR